MNYTKAKYYTYNGMYDDAVGDFTLLTCQYVH